MRWQAAGKGFWGSTSKKATSSHAQLSKASWMAESEAKLLLADDAPLVDVPGPASDSPFSASLSTLQAEDFWHFCPAVYEHL